VILSVGCSPAAPLLLAVEVHPMPPVYGRRLSWDIAPDVAR
jgi:hypothetical protein